MLNSIVFELSESYFKIRSYDSTILLFLIFNWIYCFRISINLKFVETHHGLFKAKHMLTLQNLIVSVNFGTLKQKFLMQTCNCRVKIDYLYITEL